MTLVGRCMVCRHNMKQKAISWSQLYGTALQKYILRGSPATLHPALLLGGQAVTLGFETLDLATIHERTLATLKLSNRTNGLVRRAKRFFSEAISPIIEAHHAARRSATLMERTAELAASHCLLQRGIVRRKSMEAAFKKSGEHYTRLLTRSLHLEQGLRRVTHRVLAAQECERQFISYELQDQIAQTLLGINVRLLSLKLESKSNPAGAIKKMKDEISSVQRLVVRSAHFARRASREISSL